MNKAKILNYMVMTHPSLSPQLGIWGNLLGLRGRVVIICVREVSLDTGKFHSTYIGMNACGYYYSISHNNHILGILNV